MSNTWFTSDTHFGHANIIKYSSRPFTNVDAMNEALIRNWNACVKPDDDVWHLGDFAFMKLTQVENVLRRLNGSKNVVLGNHDSVVENNQEKLLSSGLLSSVQNYKEITVNGRFIVLFHYGQRVWNRSHRGSIMLYGHSHGSLPPHGRSVDVGVDCKELTDEYRPVSIDEIVAYMDKRVPEVVDHHGKR